MPQLSQKKRKTIWKKWDPSLLPLGIRIPFHFIVRRWRRGKLMDLKKTFFFHFKIFQSQTASFVIHFLTWPKKKIRKRRTFFEKRRGFKAKKEKKKKGRKKLSLRKEHHSSVYSICLQKSTILHSIFCWFHLSNFEIWNEEQVSLFHNDQLSIRVRFQLPLDKRIWQRGIPRHLLLREQEGK